MVGITGSVGKTSTKEMISSVLEQKYSVHKTAGNFNNEIGLPLTIFGIRESHQVAVLEMGISDFGEMHRLSTCRARMLWSSPISLLPSGVFGRQGWCA